MRTALALLFALLCSIAVAHTDGIYNRAANSVGDTQGIDSAVSSGVAALACSYTPVTTGTQNVAYTGATPAASGGVLAYTFSETGSLPTGLTINSGTGVISGTPSVSGSFTNIQVKVTDAALTVANCGTAFTLTIASAFQGPGDVASGAIAWGSCARVYQASLASTATSLCDLKDKTTGTVAICTLRGSSTGFVDLAATYCTGSTTPAAACAAAAGGSCIVSKIYDQTTTGNDGTQATAANMPGLVFSALNGLPGLQCGSPVQLTTPGLTQAQPYSFSTVYIRTSGAATGAAIGAGNGAMIGSDAVAGNGRIGFNSPITFGGVTDNAWHALSGVGNGAAGAYNIDGTDVTAQNAGATTFTGNALRFCTDNSNFLVGKIMEAGMWPAALTPTQRGNLNTNQHSAANGYNF